MITREQYLIALELIDNYHRQKTTRLTLKEFVDLHKIELSSRTHKALFMTFKYADEINEYSILSVRNLGDVSRNEWFNELKSKI